MYATATTQKIFGIGLNKTGTSTLAKCLSLLGYERHISCRRDLLLKYRSGQLNDIFSITDQNNTFEDWPWPLMYKELFFRYESSAKFILTTRANSAVWLESLKRHSLRTPVDNHCRLHAYGYNYPHGFEDHHIKFYDSHNKKVKEFFEIYSRKENFLEISFDSGGGWEELCRFLGKETPDIEFPHENKGSEAGQADVHVANMAEINRQFRLSKKI